CRSKEKQRSSERSKFVEFGNSNSGHKLTPNCQNLLQQLQNRLVSDSSPACSRLQNLHLQGSSVCVFIIHQCFMFKIVKLLSSHCSVAQVKSGQYQFLKTSLQRLLA
ncbi:hypothetical protein M9458_053810, partial [Cirrhinus mrigala]